MPLDVLVSGNNLARLTAGLLTSLNICLLSSMFSISFGIPIGFMMSAGNRWIRGFMKAYLEMVRFIPQLVLLFIVFFWLGRIIPVNLSASDSAIIVFTLWGTAEMGDLVRGAISSIPKHQLDSSKALGMTLKQSYCYIIFPQAFRRLLPQTVNLLTRIIKTSSIVVLIGVTEFTKVIQQIIDVNRFERPDLAIHMYAFLMLVYYIVCESLNLLASRLESIDRKGVA